MNTIENHCQVCKRFLPSFALYKNDLCFYCKGNINTLNGNFGSNITICRRIIENIEIGTTTTKIFIKTKYTKYNTNIGGISEAQFPHVGTDIIKREM